MATKTITVTEEAYESLKALKRSEESFSETLLRITGHRRDVWKGYGTLYGERGEALAEALGESERRADRDYRKKHERLFSSADDDSGDAG